MKMLNLIRLFLTLGVIVGPLPNIIANGQTIDAVPVMADFNWLMNQVNANAAPLANPTFTGTLAGAAFAFTGNGTIGGTLGLSGALTLVGATSQSNAVTGNVSGSATAATYTDTGASIALVAGTYIIYAASSISMAGGAVGTGLDYRVAELRLTDNANTNQFLNFSGHCNSEQTHDTAVCVLAQPLVVAAPTTYKTRFGTIQNSGVNTTITGCTLTASTDYPHVIIATRIA